jgi:1,4-dihydroxy-2-naphthoate octaprenyltransferase
VTRARIWFDGARPKTLGAAIAPVLVGTAAASLDAPTIWWRAAAALVVALALQVGANYANDYSDGVRGTDADRRGPVRLTATGLATPAAVRNAAIISFAIAAVVGAALCIVVNPWLLLVGAAALVAAITYTGGPKPYGYLGLGELMVLAFFGVVATVGSAYVQHSPVPGVTWPAALAVGLPACALLGVNNLRDIETDRVAGKRTVAVRLGAAKARLIYSACIIGALVAVAACGAFVATALLGLLAAPLAPVQPPQGPAALGKVVRYQLATAALLAAGLWLG